MRDLQRGLNVFIGRHFKITAALAKPEPKAETMLMIRAPRSLSSARKTCLAAAFGALMAAAPLAHAADTGTPQATIGTLYDALREIEAPNAGDATSRAKILTPVIDQVFDIPSILRASIGLRYAQIAPADQARLLQAFRQYTVARYVSTFKPGSNAQFSVANQQRSLPGGVPGTIVDTKIGSGSDDGTAVDYVLHQGASGYRVVDVLLDAHISQVATNRADFAAALSQGGAQALIDLLDRKTKSFLNG